MGKFPEEFANCSSCEIYEPSCQRIEGEDEVVLKIDVKDHRKSQLHVKTEKGRLIIWGERRVGEISLRKTIRFERHWKKDEIRPVMFGDQVNGTKLCITIKKQGRGTVWSEVKNHFSTPLNSMLRKSNSMLGAHGNLAYRIAVITLLLTQIAVMTKCSCSTYV